MTGDRVLRAETVLHIDEHVFMLIDDYEGGLPPLPYANGLFGVHPGVVAVATGIATGPVNIAVELLEGPPAEEVNSAWEAVAEEPFEVLGGELVIGSLETGPEPELPELLVDAPGDYRIRVHARGRSAHYDYVVSEPYEDYLIQVWPSPPEPGRVLRLDDLAGR